MGVESEPGAAARGARVQSEAVSRSDAGEQVVRTTRADASSPERAVPLLEPDLPRPPTAESVGFTISSLGFAVSSRFVETLAPLELEPREFALMRAVQQAEGQTQQAIGSSLHIPASRMVAFVDALEARGLLERRSNPHDRRARALHLTHSGTELLLRALARAAAFEQEMHAASGADTYAH